MSNLAPRGNGWHLRHSPYGFGFTDRCPRHGHLTLWSLVATRILLAMWTTLLELLLLRRPDATPPAFWRWFQTGRIALVLIWAAGVVGAVWMLVKGLAPDGTAWTGFFQTFPGQTSRGRFTLISLIPIGFVLLFVL